MRERGRMGASFETQRTLTGWRRWTIDAGVLTAVGLLLGVLGPFGSHNMPPLIKYGYWLTVILGGGVIGVALDEALSRRVTSTWRRVAIASVIMTPAVSLFVLLAARLILRQHAGFGSYAALLGQVFVLCLPIMAVRALVWRPPQIEVETRTLVEPPLPEAEATFRRRLSARRRVARLIAVEAHDHYLRVHTEAGDELITLRFADALAELTRAHGYQTHRSWWVAADAIEAVAWRRGQGEARLAGGVTAPVSRTYAPRLRDAGWL